MPSTPVAIPDADGKEKHERIAMTPTSKGTPGDGGPNLAGTQRDFTRMVGSLTAVAA